MLKSNILKITIHNRDKYLNYSTMYKHEHIIIRDILLLLFTQKDDTHWIENQSKNNLHYKSNLNEFFDSDL